MTEPDLLEPYTVGLAVVLDPPAPDVRSWTIALLEDIGRESMAAGATLIGHVKCHVTLSDGTAFHGHLTTLRLGATCEGAASRPVDRLELDLAVLVYGIPRTVVEDVVRGALDRAGVRLGRDD
jgi:hypothetical protein